jgi:hypothetical protein
VPERSRRALYAGGPQARKSPHGHGREYREDVGSNGRILLAFVNEDHAKHLPSNDIVAALRSSPEQAAGSSGARSSMQIEDQVE